MALLYMRRRFCQVSAAHLTTARSPGPAKGRPRAPRRTIIDIDEETVVLLDEAIATLMKRGPGLRRRRLACQGVQRHDSLVHLDARHCGYPASEESG
jgi:hypothetical protein